MSETLKRTPLYSDHERLGARLIDFGGWALPVQYKPGTLKEHANVRNAVGLFDVSHMGEVFIRGADARAAVQNLVTNDVDSLGDGAALYTLMCREHGGIIDDCIVYRRNAEEFLIIVNAANRDKDIGWIRENCGAATITDESDATALIAIQGPKARALTKSLSDADTDSIGRFQFMDANVAGVPCMIARTGYTGEDGFELACPGDGASTLWNALLKAGESAGAMPIGLGARDTLRLEAKLCLYGNDITEETNPYEAVLGWAVKLEAGDFIGREALVKIKENGVDRKLVGFSIEGRGIARAGYPVKDDSGKQIGVVTSGGPGITVGGAIGMAYVPTEMAKAGNSLTIDCRGRDVSATIVKGPFYKREVQ